MTKTTSLNGAWDFKRVGKKACKIKVPANWYKEGHDFAGRAEYSREFTLKSKSKNKRYFLVFKGVDYFCDVKLNGKKAGSHEGYFQEFKLDVTNLIKQGKNTLTAAVNSPKEDKKAWPDRKYLIKGIFNHHDARPGTWFPTPTPRPWPG